MDSRPAGGASAVALAAITTNEISNAEIRDVITRVPRIRFTRWPTAIMRGGFRRGAKARRLPKDFGASRGASPCRMLRSTDVTATSGDKFAFEHS